MPPLFSSIPVVFLIKTEQWLPAAYQRKQPFLLSCVHFFRCFGFVAKILCFFILSDFASLPGESNCKAGTVETFPLYDCLLALQCQIIAAFKKKKIFVGHASGKHI